MDIIKEKSCGAVVYRDDKGRSPQVLLIKHRKGRHWSFPKGHVEAGESEHQTAVREVKEETGVGITILPGFRRMVSYSPKPGVLKDVVYFFAKAEPKPVFTLQKEEVRKAIWIDIKKAGKLMRFENDRKLIADAEKYIIKEMSKKRIPLNAIKKNGG